MGMKEAKEARKGRFSSDLVVELYIDLLSNLWEIVSALVGEPTLALLFLLAVRKLGDKYPFLTSLGISEEGLNLESTKEACRTLSPLEIHRGFHSLVNHLFHLFSSLAEGVISRELFPKVFPKIREAERIISQK
jgi:hypothetical protein